MCILFTVGCHVGNSQNDNLTHKDSARNDIPVRVDTTFADTAKVQVDSVLIITEPIIDSKKKDTISISPVKLLTVQEVYTSFIGIREKTGNNDGKEVEMFLKTVGLGKGYPWCAAFVKYSLLQGGVKRATRINGMALTCENKDNMVYKSGKKLQQPKVGDVFTLYYVKLKRIGHTGFYDGPVNASFFQTVEGNTNVAGSREGDGVYKKKRSYNATHSISRWDY